MAHMIKSIVYLAGFSTLGYVILKLTEPSPEKIKAIRGSTYSDPQSNENQRKTQLILNKLKEAAYSEPIYLKKKKPSEEEEQSKQPSKREIN